MPRRQDVLFLVLGFILIVMLAFGLQIAVLALVGAFACGSLYLLGHVAVAGRNLRTAGFHLGFPGRRAVIAGADIARHLRRAGD